MGSAAMATKAQTMDGIRMVNASLMAWISRLRAASNDATHMMSCQLFERGTHGWGKHLPAGDECIIITQDARPNRGKINIFIKCSRKVSSIVQKFEGAKVVAG
jgi:hypothetical protein